ncbi:hypothetical protein [Persicobacter diffluens]|uniref:DUF5045 domain-containing protein n=1 Tax=Persicobacter diffluens TaxID=981 RepID=A0AAN5AMQ3_9BACT|nr:hypothetical protein PEDI_52410 [Persicobacter diffluens]
MRFIMTMIFAILFFSTSAQTITPVRDAKKIRQQQRYWEVYDRWGDINWFEKQWFIFKGYRPYFNEGDKRLHPYFWAQEAAVKEQKDAERTNYIWADEHLKLIEIDFANRAIHPEYELYFKPRYEELLGEYKVAFLDLVENEMEESNLLIIANEWDRIWEQQEFVKDAMLDRADYSSEMFTIQEELQEHLVIMRKLSRKYALVKKGYHKNPNKPIVDNRAEIAKQLIYELKYGQ